MYKSFLNLAAAKLAILLMLVSAPGAFADNISFNYQGRVKVQDQPFNGVGLIKLAILNTSGTAVLWSNDGTVGTGGNGDLPVPGSAIGLEITDGVISVQVGDESIPGMEPLDSAIMVSDTPLRLRVWFSNGSLGFQELKPDQKLMDITLSKLQTGTEDFTIYVNGTTGNDANNGLTEATAKKTISGAVDILPDKIRCNITVSISPGTYRELVTPHGLSVAYGNKLSFTGDTSWSSADNGAPAVIIDGADTGDTPIRDFCFYARQCTGVIIEGINFQNAKGSGLKLENGTYTVNRCVAENIAVTGFETGYGFQAGPQCYATFNECISKDNENAGYSVASSSRAFLTTCTATNNIVGLFSSANSITQLFGYNSFSQNDVGVQANAMSAIGCGISADPDLRTRIQNNDIGAVVNWGGQFSPADAIMSGNGVRYDRYYGTIIGVDPEPPVF